MKRILSIMLTMMMVLSMFAGMSLNASAAVGDDEEYVYSEKLYIVDGIGNGDTTFGWSQIDALNTKIPLADNLGYPVVITFEATSSPTEGVTIFLPNEAKIIGKTGTAYANVAFVARQDVIIEDLRLNSSTSAAPDVAFFMNPMNLYTTTNLYVIGNCEIINTHGTKTALKSSGNLIINARNVFESDDTHPGTLLAKGGRSGIEMFSDERNYLRVNIPVTAESVNAGDTLSGGFNARSEITTIEGSAQLNVVGARAGIRVDGETLIVDSTVVAGTSNADSGAFESAVPNVTVKGTGELYLSGTANGNGVYMRHVVPANLTFEELAHLSITGAGAGSGIRFLGMENKTVNFDLPSETTVQGGATGQGINMIITGSGDLFVNNNGQPVNFKGGSTSGHGITPTNNLVIGGNTTINAKGNGTGKGVSLTFNNSLTLRDNINLTIEGGTAQPGMEISGMGKVNYSGGTQVMTVKNNSASIEEIPCHYSSSLTPWDISMDGYITLGNGMADDIICHIPAGTGKTAVITRTSNIPAITTNAGEVAYAMVGAAHSITLDSENNPTTWAIKSGALPSGLSINNSGVVSGTPSAAGTYKFVVTATNAVGTSAPIEYIITVYTKPTITVKSTGLTGLRVDQAVTGSIIYEMTGGTFAPIGELTSAHFDVSNLPNGLSLGTLERTSDTVVTIPVVSAPKAFKSTTTAVTVPANIPKANIANSTEDIPVVGTVTASAVAKGYGGNVSAVPSLYGEWKKHSITVDEITNLGATEQVVEYAISLQDGLTGAALDGLDWGVNKTFVEVPDGGAHYDLYADTTYYIYARTRENQDYLKGTALSAAIKTNTQKHGISFAPVGKPDIGGYGTITAQETGVGHLPITPKNINSADELDEDKNIVFTATPDPGYRVKEWKDNNEVVNGVNTTYTINRIAEGHYVTVEFELITFPVVFTTASGKGTVVASVDVSPIQSGDFVQLGKEVRFIATAEKGYRLKSWKLNGEVVPYKTTYDFKIEELTSAVTVDVEFEAISGGSGVGSGPSATDPKYTVTFETDGGSEVAKQTVASGYMASRPIRPTKEGFTFVGWYVDAEFTEEYDFDAKVKGNTTIYAKWAELGTEPPTPEWQNPFSDVSKNNWFYNDVAYAIESGIFSGTSDTTFAPNSAMTRAMFVTVLWRIEGSPAAGASPFTDVAGTTWYSEAVTWAAEKDIVSGVGGGLFAPNAEITREQMAAMLYRYEEFSGKIPEAVVADAEFADGDVISAYAREAVDTLVSQGLLNGKLDNLFDPAGTATRAEVAAMLHRFLEALK